LRAGLLLLLSPAVVVLAWVPLIRPSVRSIDSIIPQLLFPKPRHAAFPSLPPPPPPTTSLPPSPPPPRPSLLAFVQNHSRRGDAALVCLVVCLLFLLLRCCANCLLFLFSPCLLLRSRGWRGRFSRLASSSSSPSSSSSKRQATTATTNPEDVNTIRTRRHDCVAQACTRTPPPAGRSLGSLGSFFLSFFARYP
jgi:hypothetical protein